MDYTFSHIGIPVTEDRDWDGFYEPGKIHYTDFSKDEFGLEGVRVAFITHNGAPVEFMEISS